MVWNLANVTVQLNVIMVSVLRTPARFRNELARIGRKPQTCERHLEMQNCAKEGALGGYASLGLRVCCGSTEEGGKPLFVAALNEKKWGYIGGLCGGRRKTPWGLA